MRNVGMAVIVGALVLSGLSGLVFVGSVFTGYTFGGPVKLLLGLGILACPAGLVAGIVLILVGGKRTQPR